MAITIEGIKLGQLTLEINASGEAVIAGSYQLMASNGSPLAKQSFNDYNGVKITASPETKKLFFDLHKSLKNDIESPMGFTHV